MRDHCCPNINNKEGIVTTKTGDYIYFIYTRPSHGINVLTRLKYDSTGPSFTGVEFTEWARFWDT